MADTLDVLTLDEGKRALSIDETDDTAEEVLAGYITAVSRLLDQRFGPVVARTVTESLDGGCRTIRLGSRPARSITSVTEYRGSTPAVLDAITSPADTGVGYLADAYPPDLALLSGTLRRRSGSADSLFPTGRRNIVVVYSAGRYASTTAVDARFKRAAAITLENHWRDRQQTAGQFGEFDVPIASFPTFALPRAAEDLLSDEAWYQRPHQVW